MEKTNYRNKNESNNRENENMVENLELECKFKKILNLFIFNYSVINFKLSSAKQLLEENPWYFIKITIRRKELDRNKYIDEKSKIVKLKEGSIEIPDSKFKL